MYRTCLYCHADLGDNQVIEHLPIGRRLAFDQARGRLWVVCRKCERWNLTPFDERWEAIEECEREYRSTTRRFATDNVGLARLAEGLELVRIGEPLRPEFAAWRYGDQFGRRRRKHLMVGTAVSAGVIGLVFAPTLIGLSIGGGGMWQIISQGYQLIQSRRRVATIEGPAGEKIGLNQGQVGATRIVPSENAEFALVVPNVRGWYRAPMADSGTWLGGEAALDAAAKILPRLNASGGKRTAVKDAATVLDDLKAPENLFGSLAARLANSGARFDRGATLKSQPAAIRLALEMAAHEQTERVWLAGELLDLEQAWRDAEELAAIADSLGVSTTLEGQIDALKRRDP